MKVKGIIFDLDDTLADTRTSYEKAVEICHKVFNDETKLNLSLEEFTKVYNHAKHETKAMMPSVSASHNRAIFFQKLVEHFYGKVHLDLIYTLYETYYEYIYKTIVPYPHAIELLEWLEETNRNVAILSDGTIDVRLKKIHALGLGKYVDYLVSSEEIGVEKPDKRAYLAALQKLKLDKSEVIFVGNSINDITGGENLDMITIRVDLSDYDDKSFESSDIKPDYTIYNLRQVKQIIEEMEKN